MTRLVVTFPGRLTPEAVSRIRSALADVSESEFRTVVLEMGGVLYDLDQPLTIRLEGEHTTVEQPVEAAK